MQAGRKLGVWAAALAAAALPALAIDFGALRPQGYISDFAGVIDAGTRGQIERYAGELERATGAQLALVTVRTLGGEPVEDVANTLFRKWGVGQKGQNSGVLLLLAIEDRRSRLEVGYGPEPIITDGDAGGILRAMGPYLRERRYGDALLMAANAIGTRITQAKGVSMQAPGPRRPAGGRTRTIPPLIVFGGVGLFLLLASLINRRARRRYQTAGATWYDPIFLGNPPGWTPSGGGFGGYDSGDSFGGFGGGDSGGGGASSSW